MRMLYPIEERWLEEQVVRWQSHPDFEKLVDISNLGDYIQKIYSGRFAAFGFEDGEWTGIATLEPFGDQAEVAMFAPGKSKEVTRFIATIALTMPGLNSVYMKIEANRFNRWEQWGKDKWDRAGRAWGWLFAGYAGDPIKNTKWYAIYRIDTSGVNGHGIDQRQRGA